MLLRCRLCNKRILFDFDTVHEHCRRHGSTFAQYRNEYLKQVSGQPRPRLVERLATASPVGRSPKISEPYDR